MECYNSFYNYYNNCHKIISQLGIFDKSFPIFCIIERFLPYFGVYELSIPFFYAELCFFSFNSHFLVLYYFYKSYKIA